MYQKQILFEKLKEATASVLPISLIVMAISFVLVPVDAGLMLSFILATAMLILGMGLFTLGADMSMSRIGNYMGSKMTKSRKLGLVLVISFALGVAITVAEPDLQVLAGNVPEIDTKVLILTVSVGVGFFLMLCMVRILFSISLRTMLIVFYAIVFAAAFLSEPSILSVAFDSGGVTTGPMTVPFIMAIGVGLASMRADRSGSADSFGLIALCSIGPILAVLLLGIFYEPDQALYSPTEVPAVETTRDVALLFAHEIPEYFKEVAVALIPIAAAFALFQMLFRRYKRHQLMRVGFGFLFTYIGLAMFLCGVNVGFMPVGQIIGAGIADCGYAWLLIPIGMVIGYFIVAAEPAVHVLTKQVEEISNGFVTAKMMQTALSVGVCISVGIAMLRILTGISVLWFLIPGYVFALVLTRYVSPIFTGIAYDSGGVASGPMTATFLLPFAMGACEALGGNVMTDAFGIVAMVAMTPLITIQMMGFITQMKEKAKRRYIEVQMHQLEDDILYFD